MKKILLIVFIICTGFFQVLTGQKYTDHLYTPSDSIFNNPERGFYKYTSRGSASGSLSKSSLENFYYEGYTLIYRIYYLQDFVDVPISDAYLTKIREDFQIIRESGIKVVLRFAYTSNSTEPYGDATPEQVEEHIGQLKPLLQENADVIAVLQAGFIGAWGEWYYTDHFATGSPNNVTAEDLQERSDLVYSLLDALPSSRQIQLRYVGYKMDFFGDTPITDEEAYSGNAKSRIAHHNDCFLSSSNDVGTYKTASDRTYLKADSKYTSVGGETCKWYEPRSNCDTALVEMARYHWSFINIDYFGNTIQNWKENGCFDDIRRKLGYRYQLSSSTLQDSCRQGGTFHGSIQLTNVGFSNPYNPRSILIVMRNKVTKQEFFLPLNTDIRKNPLGEVIELEFEGGIPTEAENGSYDLFLNLPDPMISLRNNPRYSIQLANENTWEEATGYNRLSHTLILHPSSSASEYSGTDFFLTSDEYYMPVYQDIMVDGENDDWSQISPAFTDAEHLHASSVKVYNDTRFLYFIVNGQALYPNSRLFIDSDNNPGTGMNFQKWQKNGMDWLVENSGLYAYSGVDGSSAWTWEYIDPVITASNNTVLETAIPLNSLDHPGDTIRFGYLNGNSGYSSVEYLPDETNPALVYTLDGNIDQTPVIFATQYADNAILYWGIRENDTKFRIIERSSQNENSYNVIAFLSPDVVSYTDPYLTTGESFYYRSYLTDFYTVTPHTPSIFLSQGSGIFKYSEIMVDGDPDDWNAIKPNVTAFTDNTYTLRMFADAKNLNILVTGSHISRLEIYLETDDDSTTGIKADPWITEGVDFRISRDSLFSFQQEWEYVGMLSNTVSSDSILELSIPFADITLGDNTKIRAGAILSIGSDTLYLPFKGHSFAVYDRVTPTGPPTSFHLVSSETDPTSRLIIRWDKCSNCDGHVIEKLTGNPGSFEFLAELDNKAYQYIDDSLDNHTVYTYRMYSYNPAGQSDYTRAVSGSTHDVGISTRDIDDRFRVFTDPSNQQLMITINDPELTITSIALYDFSGRQVYFAKWNKGEQELSIPIEKLNSGIYLIQLKFLNGQYSEKIFLN